MKKMLGLLGCLVATSVISQNAVILPQNQRGACFEWNASPDAAAVGYRLYYGPGSGTYTNSVIAGNKTQGLVSNLQNNETYYFAAVAYDSVGAESPFSNEVRVNLGPAPSVFYTNILGVGYYQLTQTRNTNDNVFRMLQSGDALNWGSASGVQKKSETLIDLDTYQTTWLIPSQQPPILTNYFKSEWLINFENPGYSLKPKNLRVMFY